MRALKDYIKLENIKLMPEDEYAQIEIIHQKFFIQCECSKVTIRKIIDKILSLYDIYIYIVN